MCECVDHWLMQSKPNGSFPQSDGVCFWEAIEVITAAVLENDDFDWSASFK